MNDLSWTETRRLVHERAGYLCEYCQTSQHITAQAMHVDHIDPSGGDVLDNLCLACGNCNLSKAHAISALDPATNDEVPLFNPRVKYGRNISSGYMTAQYIMGGLPLVVRQLNVLRSINQTRVIEARAIWVAMGLHPPP